MPVTPIDIRKIIIEQSYNAHVGHIGSSLSVVEIISTIYDGIIQDEDRFVMSKGHAALALYAALYLTGKITKVQLDSFCKNGYVGVHPEALLDGVDFSTGSLGMGISYGAGHALASKIRGTSGKSYVLMSDAECNEGSVWESAIFAAKNTLNALTVIVDANGQQALGKTKDISGLTCDNIADKFDAFGWVVDIVNGHNVTELSRAIKTAYTPFPHAIIARTVFGKGVSFMENQLKWHYMPMTEDEYKVAMNEVQNKG